MPDAVCGTFVNQKYVTSRRMVQMVIEVPIEHAGTILRLFGTPGGDDPAWVGMARLKMPPGIGHNGPPATPDTRDAGAVALTRCAMLCRDGHFQKWLLGGAFRPREPVTNEKLTVQAVRERLGVATRSAIATDPAALEAWRALDGQYQTEARFGPAASR